MPDAAEIKSIIGQINDPLVRRPIGDIGILTAIDSGRRGVVTVTLAIPVPGLGDYADLVEEVKTKTASIDGVKKVEVIANDMRDEERESMMGLVMPAG